tara:strand:+ start:24190 stop:24465 length:276 start_codon:yes stop_codon:yes gene_type:complete
MLFEAFLEPDNKTTHRLTPVLNRHLPFLTGIFYCSVHHFSSGIVAGEDFPLLDGFTDNAVKRFNGVGGVNCPANIFWVIEQGIEVVPVRPP